MGEFCEVCGSGEEAGVGGYAAEDAGVFVLDFALDNSLAKGFIVCRWRNLWADLQWRIEGGIRHGQGGEKFAPTEAVERFVSEAFECGAETMKPMSLYSARLAGSAASGVVEAARRSSSRVRVFRNNFSYAGRPEEWASNMRMVTS